MNRVILHAALGGATLGSSVSFLITIAAGMSSSPGIGIILFFLGATTGLFNLWLAYKLEKVRRVVLKECWLQSRPRRLERRLRRTEHCD